MTWFSPEYKAYIRSPEWQAKRARKLLKTPYCERCGSRRRDWMSWLEVDHKTYKRLGHEWMRDLQVLCNGPESNKCHPKKTAHDRRMRPIRQFMGI